MNAGSYVGFIGAFMLELLAALVLLCAAPLSLSAQTPTREQVQELMNRPDAAAKIRQAIGGSGLTPDQIRSRLRALGYPDSFLDQYLAGGGDSVSVRPSDDVFRALRLLGISTESSIASDSVIGRPGQLRTDLPNDNMEVKVPLRIFGREVFAKVTNQFQPPVGGPVDPSYRLGPGDVLVLILTGDVELAHQLEVTREGFIVIPQVGQLYVAGLTLGQLDQMLAGRLAKVYSGISKGQKGTTKYQITVARLRMNQIYVVGEVIRPGAYQVSSAGTALTALYLAGGPKDNGSFRRILIRRGGAVVDSLDLYDYLLRGDTRHDIRLETGDVVFVPVRKMPVQIDGAVVRPAIYELVEGETLRDLIGHAGGFDPSALRRRIQVDRILPPAQRQAGGRDRVVLDITEDQLRDDAAPAFPLAAADSIHVFSVATRRRNVVTVKGNVWVDGPIGFRPGMRLSEAIRLAGGPKADVFLGQILVSRLLADSTRAQLRSAFRDSTGTITNDIPLAEDDEIEVFSRTDFRPDRYVVVTGAVKRAGRIPFREGMTLRDAVLQAGGLTEDAWLIEAELARIPENRSAGTIATTIRVPLDSTYIFDRGPNGEYHGPPGIAAAASGAPETALRPYDNVLILRQPDWELARSVNVAGQVRYPGRYVLKAKTETLADLIGRAGGLTKEAYPRGAELYRRLPFDQGKELRVVGRLKSAETRKTDTTKIEKTAAEDSLALGTDLAQRVGIDLTRAMERPGERDNLILQDGDSLFVPEFRAVVRVLGAVNAPTSLIYQPGWNIFDYVGAAGGPSRRGDRGHSYVVQPGGTLESIKGRGILPSWKPKPLPGSVVYVPEKDPNDKKDWAAFATAFAQILTSTIAIIVLVKR